MAPHITKEREPATSFSVAGAVESSMKFVAAAVNAALQSGLPSDRLSGFLDKLSTNLLDEKSGNNDSLHNQLSSFTTQAKTEVAPLNLTKFCLRKHTLAMALLERYRLLGKVEDYEGALRLLQGVLDRHSEAAFDANSSFTDILATAHYYHFQRTRDVSDLQQCINVARDATRTFFDPTDDRSHPRTIAAEKLLLCVSLWERFDVTRDKFDLAEAAQQAISITSNESILSRAIPSFTRFIISSLSARLCYAYGRNEDALACFEAALDIASTVNLIGRDHKVESLVDCSAISLALDGAACAIAAGKPHIAVELIEKGRNVDWKKKLQVPTDLSELALEMPEHARIFAELKIKIEKGDSRVHNQGSYESPVVPPPTPSGDPASQPPPFSSDLVDQLSPVKEYEELLKDIRKIDGFEHFMKPYTYSELYGAAKKGPIVIVNVSKYRSDALIVTNATPDRPQIVPLSKNLIRLASKWTAELRRHSDELSKGKIAEDDFENQVLKPILFGLWKEVVQPVTSALFSVAPYGRRLWWCPTGNLTFLPLHLITRTANGKRFVPSYTSSITTLLKGRKNLIVKTGPTQMLGVACSTARGQIAMPGSAKELQVLRKFSKDVKLTVLEDKRATVQNVLKGLGDNSWVHLSCHGRQDIEKPHLSRLILDDGFLFSSEIVGQHHPKGEFAFLTACHSASGSFHPYDEFVHLGADFQVAGFRSAISTMWAVDDDTAPRLIQEFYSHLVEDKKPLQGEETAETLVKAVRHLKAQGVPLARLAPFFHIGE